MIDQTKAELHKYASPDKAKIMQRFFKTGPGQYGEGDVFWGVKVPMQRKVARKFADISLADIELLLEDRVHECRLTGAIILVNKYAKLNKLGKYQTHQTKTNIIKQKEIVRFYLDNLKAINNWDLVDLSAPQILGEWLAWKLKIKNERVKIYRKTQFYIDPFNNKKAKTMARSGNLWERRVAMMATFGLIKKNEFKLALEIADILLSDEHDLIQKAVGWMLREIGKRSMAVEEKFLRKNYKKMPRMALRYAIEKFPEPKRQKYLKGLI